jgi:putative ABC transport system permease protein
MNDLRFALRQLARSPGFAATAVLTIGVGIAACTAIFSVVDNVLLRPIPYPESERLVVIRETKLPEVVSGPVPLGHLLDWRERATSFESLAAVRGGSFNLTGRGEPVRVRAARVSANYLSTLRVRPAMGRDFSPEEEEPGRSNVAILTHGFWQRQLGGRPDVLDQTLQLNGQPFTVVGVMPESFQRDATTEIFTPLAYPPQARQNRLAHDTNVVGRLKGGVARSWAQREMTMIAEQLAGQYPATNKGWQVTVTSLLDFFVADARPVLWALLGAVAFLLLIVCANVASLVVVRASARGKELAVRGALGAARGRIVRQLLTESVLLAVLGGALGVLLAQWATGALVSLAPESLPRAKEIAVDGRVLAFSFALSLAVGVGFGLWPAFQAARLDASRALREGGYGAGRVGGQRLRGALVVAEVATALMLLVGAGLLIRSFERLNHVEPGFQPRDALAVSMSLARTGYATDAQKLDFIGRVCERLRALPGVAAVGLAHVLPFSGAGYAVEFHVEGGAEVSPADWPSSNYYSVTPGYFPAMGVRLLRGRLFDDHDTDRTGRVLIVSESLARRFFAGEDPLGKQLTTIDAPGTKRRIVGVVSDVRQRSLDGEVPVQIYEPFAQQPFDSFTFVVRGMVPAAGLPAAIRAAVHSVDGMQPIASMTPLTDLVARSMARQRFAMILFSVFSGVALLLAALGIYGVLAYSVAQRRGEMAIRLVLGAQPGDVLGLVLRQGGRLVALGLGAGVVGALLLTRFIEKMLFGVSAHDPATFVAIAVLLALIAGIACLLPARRAAALDPMVALRQE